MRTWTKLTAVGVVLLAAIILGFLFLPLKNELGLSELDGTPFQISKQSNLLVFYTHQLGCPISRRGVAKIIALQSEFKKDGVGFYVVSASPQDSPEKFKNDILDYKAEIGTLKDASHEFLSKFHVNRSGHAILFSSTKGLVYSGAIDDQDDYLGSQNRARTLYLRDAIQASLRQEKPTIEETEAKGCLISLK